MAYFKPGDEVECVDASCRFGRRWFPGSAPEKGAVYTVETIEVHKHRFPDDEGAEVVCLVLRELRNYAPNGSPGYRASRFRKVQKRDLGAWLKQETSYDEEQRNPAPAKKRERVS